MPRYWAVGATWGDEDKAPEFIQQGYWMLGYSDDEQPGFAGKRDQIEPGDRLIMKKWTGTVKKSILIRAIGICKGAKDKKIVVDWLPIMNSLEVEKYIVPSIEGPYSENEDWITSLEQLLARLVEERRIEQMKKILELSSLLEDHRQIILQGPPGTSKTYQAKALAAHMLGLDPQAPIKGKPGHDQFTACRFSENPDHPKGCWEIVQFHPAYNYEDFVRGIAVKTAEDGNSIMYSTENRLFGEMCIKAAEKAAEDPDRKYILIIDEINRAHLAAVLGELIYALEYRGEAVRSLYAVAGKHDLTVPGNLYIIGTMNTADRSIGHIDYAVRRRFAFASLLPSADVIDDYYSDKTVDGPKPHDEAKVLFKAVKDLFRKDDETRAASLSPDYRPDDVQVGHTYFLAKDHGALFSSFAYKVYPLLREYYKDGILVGKDLKLSINGKNDIPIASHMASQEVKKKLDESFPKEAQATASSNDAPPPEPPASEQQPETTENGA